MIRLKLAGLLVFGILVASACSTEKVAEPKPVVQPEPTPEEAEATKSKSMATTSTSVAGPASAPVATGVRPVAAAVEARVADAKQRLSASEPGQKIWNAIEAQGGLATWYANGPIAYRFNYQPLGGKRGPTDTYQIIDTWASRAHHKTRGEGPGATFGWDGTQAWISPPDAKLSTNARFWALTPYYFVAIPFVLADRGVKLAAEPDAEFEGKTYDVIRATFEGVGDAPDDFYVIYLDKKTSRVTAIRYIVTYPGFFEAGKHSPEKLMAYIGSQEINGITLPTNFPTYKWDGQKHGEKVTTIELTEVSFQPETASSIFAAPEGAKIQTEY